MYCPGYARKMLEIIERSEHTKIWSYTRSGRVPTIAPVPKDIAALPNMQPWLSADAETGSPGEVPEGARVAWMQTDVDEDTGESDLVFLDHPLRKLKLPLHVLEKARPKETPEGTKKGTTCATCRYCRTG